DKMELGIGAIYTLEAVAREAPDLQGPVIEVLTALVRQSSRSGGEKVSGDPLAADVRAALTVILRRDREQDQGRVDLHGVDLRSTRLGAAQLDAADLQEARLEGAWLAGANLEGANLEAARLDGADLSDAHLAG